MAILSGCCKKISQRGPSMHLRSVLPPRVRPWRWVMTTWEAMGHPDPGVRPWLLGDDPMGGDRPPHDPGVWPWRLGDDPMGGGRPPHDPGVQPWRWVMTPWEVMGHPMTLGSGHGAG